MDKKRVLVARMVKSIKGFINMRDKKNLDYNKSELIKLMSWGSYILDNNLGEEAIDNFINVYNLFKKSIRKKEFNKFMDEKKTEDLDAVTSIFDTNESELEETKESSDEEQLYQLDLNKVKEHLRYFQEELDLMGINFLLDKTKWGNLDNYNLFLHSIEKAKVLLKGFTVTIYEYNSDIVSGNEGKSLINSLKAIRDCIATLIILSNKISDEEVWNMYDYQKTYKTFSDTIVDYMIINYLNNKNSEKRI